MFRPTFFCLATLLLVACSDAPADRASSDAQAVNGTDTSDALIHPEWSRNAVIYEMNVRQHTPQGDLKSAMLDLARIKQIGVDVIWLMPVHPDWRGQPQRRREQQQLFGPTRQHLVGQSLQRSGLHSTQSELWHLGGL